MTATHDIDELLAHREWLGALARSLVRDTELAEELVQETWLSALRSRAVPRRMRAWLETVLRHHQRKHARASRHRQKREEWAARPEAEPSVADSLAKLSAQEALARELKSLDEPLRSTLVLRYFEGLSRAQIAKRFGVPAATVGSRLERGKRTLRERLDRTAPGGRPTWMPAVIAIGWPDRLTFAPAFPSLLIAMGTTTKLFLSAAALTAIVWGVWPSSQERAAALPTSPDAGESEMPSLANGADDKPTTSQAREVVAATESQPASEASEQAASSPAPWIVHGLLLDTDAQPLAGVGVRFRSGAGSPSETHRSTSDGTFAISVSASGGRLEVDDPEWRTVGACLVPGSPGQRENVVIAGRNVPIDGHIRDTQGIAIEGATITLEAPPGFRSRFAHFLDRTPTPVRVAQSGERGDFALDDAALITGSILRVTHPSFVPAERALDPNATRGIELVLHRPGSFEELISGLVVDPLGRPFPGARVSFGAEIVETDERGLFELPRQAEQRDYLRWLDRLGGESCVLQATAPGFLPARRVVERNADGTPAWPDGLTLRLGEGEFGFSGRVVNEDGAPIADAMVWLDGLQLFSMNTGGETIEADLSGRTGDRNLMWRTDDSGAFEIPGLLDRTYSLGALDPGSGVLVRKAALHPATAGELEIVIDTGATWPRVAGTVQTRDGTPIPGATLHVMFDALETRRGDEFVRHSSMLMRRLNTDEAGAFELASVPKENLYFAVYGDEIEFESFPIDPQWTEAQALDLVLVVTYRVHVRVERPVGLQVDEIAILDGNDEALPLSIHAGKPGMPSQSAPFRGEATDTLSVAETGTTLVFYNVGQEVGRRSITLRVGELNEL